jgi:serine/threonine-protein kinase
VLPGTAEVGSTANSYEILAKLATGGMAEIFLARGASGAGVERYVVLKRVLRHRASDEHFVRMFLDEARLAAQLQHPNIAQVYDLGKLGDSYFFTMEYVHGETVRALINRSSALRRQVPISAVLAIAAGAAAGLHHAHDRRDTSGRPLDIVHRDVSPSNLMLSYEGAVKVVDFGVAKASHRSTETASGTVKGKIAYLSPEQCRASAAIDRRSDLFSLGIVMWELLTLERLYRRPSDFEQMIAIVQDPARPPSQLRPDVTPELDALVMRCLEKDPAKRFQTADELHEAIENVAVKLGAPLSTASLGRFVRELFGQRPEPWVEMRAAEAHVEGVTVTSEPIPVDLSIPVADSVDMRLGAVPDLSVAAEPSMGHRVPSEVQTTAPMPVVARNTMQAPVPPLAVTMPGTGPQVPRSQAAPPPMMRPMPMSGTGSVPSASGLAPFAVPPAARASATDLARHRSSVRIVVIASVLVAAGLLGFLLATRGGGETHVEAPPPAVAETPPAAAEPAPTPVETAPAPVETAPAPAPVEAKPTPPATTGSAEPAPAPVPVQVPTPPPPPSEGSAVESKPKQTPTKPSAVDEIAKQFAADRFADTVATCTANPSAAAQSATPCVLAACHIHDAAHARKWLRNAGLKRAQLVASCASLKTAVEEAPKRDCGADPLSCQH